MSTPLKSPRRISVTPTWHGSVSSFRTASSPVEASCTVYPASSSESRTPTRSASLSSKSRTLSATALPHRDLDDEFGPFPDLAVHVEDAPMRVHDLLGQRKPDPAPGFFRGEEGDEDPVLDLRGDPRPVVADVDPEEILLLPRIAGKEQFDQPVESHQFGKVAGCPDDDIYGAFPMACFRRIGQNVRQRLFKEGLIRIHLHATVFRFLYRKFHPGVEGDHSGNHPFEKRIHPDLPD